MTDHQDPASSPDAPVFTMPSVTLPLLDSYTYISPTPSHLPGNMDEPCVLGVDEAGRGPCLGAMVYAVSFCPLSRYDEFKALGFDDSKKLTAERRDNLAKVILDSQDYVGWAVKVISPQDISTSMHNRSTLVNLNQLAHDATIELIGKVMDERINLTQIYVDPVGPSKSYQAKLSKYFPGVQITVEPKADALYPIVSAASICAKVTRDQILEQWQWTEKGLDCSMDFGSGYPSDPNTVKWLDRNQVPFFGYPSLIRFSWKTIHHRLVTTTCEWSDDEEAAEKKPRKSIKRLLSTETKQDSHYEKGQFYKSFRLASVAL
ncbi:ribonuclease HII [Hesseltinella vesiculosa]|uniref:Ribonuclease n=1 Tax=Hesseltinella vesiculosa TaxID=101127 RepID=A0A1X2GRX6_9FUNG|nr:ribonuclease HII [Hesseltinella vesiculosa]